MDLTPHETAIVGVHYIHDVVGESGKFRDFFHEGVRDGGVIPAAKRLLDAGRAAGSLVVLTKVAFRPDYVDLLANGPLLGMVIETRALLRDGPGVEIVPELGAQPSDIVVEHRRLGGFHDSELDTLLRANAVSTVVIAGVATNIAVEGAARQALDLGYRTIVVPDASSAASDQEHRASLATLSLIGEVASVAEVTEALAASL